MIDPAPFDGVITAARSIRDSDDPALLDGHTDREIQAAVIHLETLAAVARNAAANLRRLSIARNENPSCNEPTATEPTATDTGPPIDPAATA